MKEIELEYRSEIPVSSFKTFKENLEKIAKLKTHSKRLSFMAFGDNVDIRVRITNGKSEVVLKKGGYHESDRVEVSQEINNDQFLGFVKIFSVMITNCKIGERENFVYKIDNKVTVTLVKSKTLAYVEFEIMSDQKDLTSNRKILMELITSLGLDVLDEVGFNDLCDRLTENEDWNFDLSSDNIKRLSKLLDEYSKNGN